jgi:Ni/Fe-hydrogenase b-type cytochrome subunit
VSRERRSGTEKRHHPVVRVTHWVNVAALTIMVGSGLRIFNAYPGFAPRGGRFCCYPFEGRPIPEWLTFGGWLAGARNWHFAMMWVLVVNGLVYLGWIYLHGEWRDLVPRRGDRHQVWQMIRFYLTLRSDHPDQGKHNALQKLSYFAVPLIAAAAVVSGLAIWKPVSLAWLTNLMGGYVWARYWHFLAMLSLVAFAIAHVIMVIAVDPYSMRSMLTGHYDHTLSPQARNARPFTNLRPPHGPEPGVEQPATAPTSEPVPPGPDRMETVDVPVEGRTEPEADPTLRPATDRPLSEPPSPEAPGSDSEVDSGSPNEERE